MPDAFTGYSQAAKSIRRLKHGRRTYVRLFAKLLEVCLAAQVGGATEFVGELFFGLITPVGVDRQPVHEALRNQLRAVNYEIDPVKISSKLAAYGKARRFRTEEPHFLKRKHALMDAGNDMRKWHKSGDAAALLAMMIISDLRDKPRSSAGVAYVIDSLKHPAEVERLRATYGPAFVAIATYAPESVRRERITAEAHSLLHQPTADEVNHLMFRDEEEEDKLGQRVRDAFQLADIVVDVTQSESVEEQIRRIVELLFGNLQLTPSMHEYGMAIARTAQVRSGSLARQIGAAILRRDGSVAAVGTNEVARPAGGQYWASDDANYPNGRDVKRGFDSSDWFRHRAITDVIEVLREHGKLTRQDTKKTAEQLFDEWYHKESWLKKTQISNTIDYIRAIHAEMAAITDAVRHGIELQDCVLFTTTFPCHDCAKHIVASGLREVVYLAPYPKSLVAELYSDSIEINVRQPDSSKVHFRSFVGIAPTRYADLFNIGKRDRKDARGRAIKFESGRARITLPEYAPAPTTIMISEQTALKPFVAKFTKLLRAKKKQPTLRARRER